jgi:hypothetical protein
MSRLYIGAYSGHRSIESSLEQSSLKQSSLRAQCRERCSLSDGIIEYIKCLKKCIPEQKFEQPTKIIPSDR